MFTKKASIFVVIVFTYMFLRAPLVLLLEYFGIQINREFYGIEKFFGFLAFIALIYTVTSAAWYSSDRKEYLKAISWVFIWPLTLYFAIKGKFIDDGKNT